MIGEREKIKDVFHDTDWLIDESSTFFHSIGKLTSHTIAQGSILSVCICSSIHSSRLLACLNAKQNVMIPIGHHCHPWIRNYTRAMDIIFRKMTQGSSRGRKGRIANSSNMHGTSQSDVAPHRCGNRNSRTTWQWRLFLKQLAHSSKHVASDFRHRAIHYILQVLSEQYSKISVGLWLYGCTEQCADLLRTPFVALCWNRVRKYVRLFLWAPPTSRCDKDKHS